MNTIEITHNPFIVDTVFLINGQTPADGCKLSSYKESRLQLWVEKLFDELSNLFNGDNNFRVTFTGVESDYLDILEAANAAQASGMHVELNWITTVPTEQRLEHIRTLIADARTHPMFGRFIEKNQEIRQSIDEAFSRDFDVYVVATMSSGKSTLINAMLGRDLLPAANEATTATIARIADNEQMGEQFTAKRYNRCGQLTGEEHNVDLELIKEWNQSIDTQRIDIEGDIIAISEREDVRLVLTDTPGPNNSQDEDHQRTTMGFIQDSKRNPLILYVLNASQLGTNDDRNLLSLVAETMCKGGKQSKDRFIFVINKMDVFDPEQGEHIPEVLKRVNTYLSQNGIHTPQIYPVSANLTRLIRKPHDLQTRKERGELQAMSGMFSEEPSMNMLQYMPITERVHRALESKSYSTLLLNSGLPAVEAMIDEYIDKYNLPHRLKRAYDAISHAIEVGLNEAQLIEQLEQDELILAHLNEEIQGLQQRLEKGFDATEFRDKLEREGKALPKETEEKLIELEAMIGPVVKELGTRFTQNSVPVSAAEIRIQEAEESLRFHHKKLVNLYEATFSSAQDIVRGELQAEYQRYVKEIFEDAGELTLPILDNIMKVTSNISFNLSVREHDIQKRTVVSGSREVSTSSWWNPFSWGSTETLKSYKTENYVDLEKLWKERITRVETEFNRLIVSAREEIDTGKNRLIDTFVAFMSHEFDTKFGELLKSLNDKTTNRTAREEAIAEAKALHSWIDDFKANLGKTLSV